VPVVVKVAAKVALPIAGAPVVRSAAVPTTGAVPRGVPPELKVIVPVGPTPELAVLTVALRAMAEFVEALGRGTMVIAVAALVIEMVSGADVLEL
jgi:hypothetical protein